MFGARYGVPAAGVCIIRHDLEKLSVAKVHRARQRTPVVNPATAEIVAVADPAADLELAMQSLDVDGAGLELISVCMLV
ncbi:MAG TPA: hypothetical protein VJ764_06810 [Steroidobacteraceae bacterium]|nr:hypothetical protein [Steroidobacteraceae bacterium]